MTITGGNWGVISLGGGDNKEELYDDTAETGGNYGKGNRGRVPKRKSRTSE